MKAHIDDGQRVDRARRLWAAYESRDWALAQSLLSTQALCTWWTSQERFVCAASIVGVNAAYPEGWSIHVLAVEPLKANRVLSLVRVGHGKAHHYAHSWFGFSNTAPYCIAEIEEFWAVEERAPAWRDGLPGRKETQGQCRDAPLSLAKRNGGAP